MPWPGLGGANEPRLKIRGHEMVNSRPAGPERTGTNPRRWVLDTYVVLSALLFPSGRLTRLRHDWRSGALVPPASAETTTELIRVLHYPRFGLAPGEQKDLLADYLPHCESVVVSGSVTTPECRDPGDRPLLELALAARADALVTGDNDLLALADAFPIPIVTPTAALATLPTP